MKIKLFKQQYRQEYWDLQNEVNSFLKSVIVHDVKVAEGSCGTADDMETKTTIVVMYE